MEQIVFGRWRLCYDPKATRQAYYAIPVGGPEQCGCCYCRNFAAARDLVYPAEVRALFENLGIDYSKEAETYQSHRLRPGLHLYGGWFHCVGRIEVEGEEIGRFDLERGAGCFNFYFGDRRDLVCDSFKGLPVLQLEFNAQVPWVLEEAEPEYP